MRPSSAKLLRLRAILRPFLQLERTPSPHGLRLLALEAFHRGRFAAGLLLADGATLLPPELSARLALLPLDEAVSRAREAFRAGLFREGDGVVELRARVLGKIPGLLAALESRGLLPKASAHYHLLLGQLSHPADVWLVGVYVKEGLRLYAPGEELDPRFLRGLEDLLEVLLLLRAKHGWGAALAASLEVSDG